MVKQSGSSASETTQESVGVNPPMVASRVTAFSRVKQFLGIGSSTAQNGEGKLFPMSITTHMMLLFLGWFVALIFYHGISLSLYNDYQTSLRKASVICDFLTDYGASSHFNCDKDSPVLFYELSSNKMVTTSVKETDISEKLDTNSIRLSTKDLASMMIAAGVSDEKDIEVPAELLFLEKSGPGGWIATALLGSTTPSTERLDSVMLSGTAITCASLQEATNKHIREPFGTIDALNVFFKTLGKKNGNSGGCDDELEGIRSVSNAMINNITGSAPRFLSPLKDGQAQSTSNVLKSAMSVPWGHYMPQVIFHAPDAESCEDKLPPELQQVSITDRGAKNYYELSGKTTCINKTLWYRYDPAKIYHATFTFGSFLLNEVFRDDDVKRARFFYQAWRGPIQFCLLVIFFYVLLILVWRFVASLLHAPVAPKQAYWRPALVQGTIADREQQAIDSRAYIDLIISTLPLIGLFGTVVGILFGLPNAADAVTAVGPGATDSVNALFENLGLAFSTTAIAVLSVIILEVFWLILQRFEEHSISDYLEHVENID